MKIQEMSFENRFQEKVREIDITDPIVEEFLFNVGSTQDRGMKEAMLAQKHREILDNIGTYSQEQVLQFAAVLLQFSPNSNLLAGRIMKKWYEENHKNGARVGSIQAGVSQETEEIL